MPGWVLGQDGSFVRKMALGDLARAVAVDAVGNIIAATVKHVKVFSPDLRCCTSPAGLIQYCTSQYYDTLYITIVISAWL